MSWSEGSFDDTVRWAEDAHGSDDRLLWGQPLTFSYDAVQGVYYLTPLRTTPGAVLRYDSDTGVYYLSEGTDTVDARVITRPDGDVVVRRERA